MEEKHATEDITVTWENGKAKGFSSLEQAERFIEKVCKKISPDREYSIQK